MNIGSEERKADVLGALERSAKYIAAENGGTRPNTLDNVSVLVKRLLVCAKDVVEADRTSTLTDEHVGNLDRAIAACLPEKQQ